ncbi:MAG: anthranilate phosphoribosyltransferase [Herpetosiphon sp.]
MNIVDAIKAVVAGRDLLQEQAGLVMEAIMSGEATAAQIAAFLTALHLKGETDAEIAGMALVMREKAVPVAFAGPVLDTCGTGGDGAQTFNISTAAAFVASGAGAVVAKHGNRAMSSQCGSADVLEGLGVAIDLQSDGVVTCLSQAGIGFMFAQRFHPAMRYAAPVRREIGIRTAFNILGPLTNPAHAAYQVVGVGVQQLAEKLARALTRMGTEHALVVHGMDGVDELSLSGPSIVWDVRAGKEPRKREVTPNELGLALSERPALMGGSVEENARIIRRVLSGEDHGPRRDVVLLNAAAALVAADRAGDLREGLSQAAAALDSGHALGKLEALVRVSQAARLEGK